MTNPSRAGIEKWRIDFARPGSRGRSCGPTAFIRIPWPITRRVSPREGAFYSSLGDSRMSYVDVRDVAAVAAATLRGAEHAGRIYELNGPEALSSSEIAAKIAKHCRRAVKYVDIPMEAQRKAMLEMAMPEWQASALLELQQYYINGKGGGVDSTLQDLLGRSPLTMDEFLEENATAFWPQQASA